MELFLGLLSLSGLSLFLARRLRRSSALMPLVAVAVAMVWFTLMGCLGMLAVGGWLWYAGCFAALAWVLIKEKKNILALLTPGFLFFVGGSAFFILLFFFTRPMLTQWDEFTFWGTAAKVVAESGHLYTVATSNLIARTYPPGLIVFNYMLQFFGAWAEYKLMAAFAVVQLAALAAPSALWGKNKAGAFVFLSGMFALPFFFEVSGLPSWSFLSCMADAPMAALFGGALCLYFADEEKDHRLFLPLGLVLMALTNVKDMGLALALIALFVVTLDLIFCERKQVAFFRLRRWWAVAATFVACAAMVVGMYLLWAGHLASAPAPVNRFDLGNAEASLGMFGMLGMGLAALLGIRPDAHFSATLSRMLQALYSPDKPVSLIGPGVVVLGVILTLAAIAWLLSATKRTRRRVLVFTLAMLFCFAAFYIFNVFTYTYILKGVESETLKDYHRYIYPFWFGWLMGTLTLLAAAASDKRTLRLRVQTARAASLGAVSLVLLLVLALGNSSANFLRVSPSLYGQRLSVQTAVKQAEQEGMQDTHSVYLISQGDDTTRFYMFGYEMRAKRNFLFQGPLLDKDGNQALDPLTGMPIYRGNAAASLIAPGENSAYPFAVECTPEQLAAFLWQQECTHILVDWPDEYILEEFAPLFEDGLSGWNSKDGFTPGRRYYRIEWQDGACSFVPVTGGAV